jgi:polyisoprenoid-binding protein YceI
MKKLIASIARATVVAASAAFLAGAALSSLPSPASASTYTLDFTDTNSDVAHLVLTTAGSFGTVTSITGTFDGHSVTEAVVFGADQQIYATGPFVDYSGLGFTDPTAFNVYWTNPTRSFALGELGVCYTGGCNTVTGFYPITSATLNGVPLAGTTPLPAAVVLFGSVLAGGGLLLRRRRSRSAIAA